MCVVCICMCVYICIYAYIDTYMCIYRHMSLYTYICIHKSPCFLLFCGNFFSYIRYIRLKRLGVSPGLRACWPWNGRQAGIALAGWAESWVVKRDRWTFCASVNMFWALGKSDWQLLNEYWGNIVLSWCFPPLPEMRYSLCKQTFWKTGSLQQLFPA